MAELPNHLETDQYSPTQTLERSAWFYANAGIEDLPSKPQCWPSQKCALLGIWLLQVAPNIRFHGNCMLGAP
jgi:hypothetical protein